MKKLILLTGGLVACMVLGGGCTNPLSQVTNKKLEAPASTNFNMAIESPGTTEEARYYSGTIGTNNARLVYWPSSEGRNDRNFFKGIYVYEKESAAPLLLSISFTSGGRFTASEYVAANDKDRQTGVVLESTDECEGKNEEGVLCGEWRDTKSKKVLPFTFTQTEKFIIEDYLKH